MAFDLLLTRARPVPAYRAEELAGQCGGEPQDREGRGQPDREHHGTEQQRRLRPWEESEGPRRRF